MCISSVMMACLHCICKCVGVALVLMKTKVQLQNGRTVKLRDHKCCTDGSVYLFFFFLGLK